MVIFVIVGSSAFCIPPSDISFYNPFEDEDSNNAQIARGSAVSRTPSGALQFVEGRYGKGILLYGKNQPLVYETAGNLDLAGGTVAAWFKPLAWEKGDYFIRQFFLVVGKDPGCSLWLYKYHDRLSFLVEHNYEGKHKVYVANAGDFDFKKGVWTHIAGTWDANRIALYVNGEYIAGKVLPTENILRGFAETFQISGQNQAPESPADTALDEFYIFRRALSKAEIRQLYESGYEAIGKTVADGAVEIVDCEYLVGLDKLKLQGVVPSRRSDDTRTLTARIRVIETTGRKESIAPSYHDFEGNRFSLFHDVGKLSPGEYKVVVTVREQAKELGEAEETFTKMQKPEWMGNMLGITEEVPEPWIPIAREDDTISVWGRRYQWKRSFLPASIVSQGNEILARPAVLKARIQGEDVVPTSRELRWTRTAPARVEMSASGKVGDVSVEASWRIEYDGFAWCRLVLSGPKERSLERLSLELPLRPEVAELQNHMILPDRFATQGRVETLTSPILKVPYVWLGNQKGGLVWCAETDRTWRLESKEREVEIIPTEKEVMLRFTMVDHAVSLEEPLIIEFGLEATPAKPRLGGWRGLRWLNEGYNSHWNRTKDDPGEERHGYLVVRDDIMEFVANSEIGEMRQGDIPRTSIYWNLSRMWEKNPILPLFHAEWSFVGEWTPIGGQANPCRACKSLQDYWLWRLKKSFDEKPAFSAYLSNIYMDTTGCNFCLNTLHGCAVRDATGKLQGKWTVLAAREFQKRLYVMMQRHYPHIKLRCHGNPLYMPQYGFVHGLIDGEHLGAAGAPLLRDLNYYHVPGFTLAGLRAMFVDAKDGLAPVFLSQTHRRAGGWKAGMETNLKVLGSPGIPASEHVAGMLFVNDIIPWAAYMNGIPFARLQKIKDEFGWDDKVELLPYWDNEKYVTLEASADPVACSLYRRPDGLLIVVMNNSDSDAEVRLSLDTAELGVNPAVTSAMDAYQAASVRVRWITDDSIRAGKPVWDWQEFPATFEMVPLKDGVMEFGVKKRNFRVLRLSY
jgi:hypothetical protein